MVEIIRLSVRAKQQLVTLKRRTWFRHWNVLCRWAFCISLSERPKPLHEEMPADCSLRRGVSANPSRQDRDTELGCEVHLRRCRYVLSPRTRRSADTFSNWAFVKSDGYLLRVATALFMHGEFTMLLCPFCQQSLYVESLSITGHNA